MGSRFRRQILGFLIALQFLTVISTPFRRRAAGVLNASAVDYFALVGFVLGLILAGMDQLLGTIFPASVTSALLIVTLVVLTGALHLDGFADTCDGIFNRGEPERRLEIMRDSRTGAFGVVGLITLLLVKYSALVSLTPSVRPLALVLMVTAARLAMAYSVVYFPYARSAGLGKMVQGAHRAISLALSTALVALLAYFLFGNLGLISVLIAGVAVLLGALYIMTKIPGLTGDSYGALCELAEVVILLVLVAGTGK